MHESNACKLARDYTAVSTKFLYDRRPKCFSAEWCCFYPNYVEVITSYMSNVKVNGSIKKMYLNFSLPSYSEIHGAVVICNKRLSVIIFNLCIFCILDYCIKTVLTKLFLFVCAAFLVNALHECCIVFICKLLILFRL